MRNIKGWLDAIDPIRDKMAVGFRGAPGISKTAQISEWVEERNEKHGEDRRLVEIITSQRMPTEVSGIVMPDTEAQVMRTFDSDLLVNLKDGDVLFFDEFLNGNIMTLNACLTLIQDRVLMSGRKMPSVLVVCAGNPQGACELLPQTKQRFLWVDVEFNKQTWADWFAGEYGCRPTAKLLNEIADTYANGKWRRQTYNYMTARTATNLFELSRRIDRDDPIWRSVADIDGSTIDQLYETQRNVKKKDDRWVEHRDQLMDIVKNKLVLSPVTTEAAAVIMLERVESAEDLKNVVEHMSSMPEFDEIIMLMKGGSVDEYLGKE